jgi:hypothetical protein
MSRKDYTKFAQAFNAILTYDGLENSTAEGIFKTMVNITASILKQDNPRFDKDRFIQAIYKGITPHHTTQS